MKTKIFIYDSWKRPLEEFEQSVKRLHGNRAGN